ncbi:unnamed protein product [Adineta steineri]|uniref:Leucine-rich repeat-containing protein 51 n=2 Tax=Adineta steineri TaxID=433720 RepID=A0A814QG49_9BILA|nr:unnamed protein product [Adineta steineri]
MFHTNDTYSDEIENENQTIESVHQLGENKKLKNENENNLEELLIKSRQLKSSKSLRLIDEQIENISTKKNSTIQSLILSCNLLDKNQQIDWTKLPKHVHHLELSGNFVKSLNGIENNNNNDLKSIGLSFNEITEVNQIFSLPKWSNICLIDLSYNILNDLTKTIESLQNLNKLRILYLHGNPISLIIDYRLYVIDSLEKLLVLDDITITAEERFRARHFSNSDQHPKDYAKFTITFGTVSNIPNPPINQNEWPLQIHRYKLRLDWFDGEKQDIDIPFDKFADFNRFNQIQIESSHSDYKPNIDFSPNHLDYSINTLIPFRDFLFHGTTCRFIHEMTEYWQPGEIIEEKSGKKKSNAKEEKKVEAPVKKKKPEDLSKLVTRTDPIEEIFAEFHVELRSILDGDYQVSFPYKCLIQQQIDLNTQQNLPIKPNKKDNKKTDSTQDKNKEKQKAQTNEPIPLPQPFQCSVHFQLHRILSE